MSLFRRFSARRTHGHRNYRMYSMLGCKRHVPLRQRTERVLLVPETPDATAINALTCPQGTCGQMQGRRELPRFLSCRFLQRQTQRSSIAAARKDGANKSSRVPEWAALVLAPASICISGTNPLPATLANCGWTYPVTLASRAKSASVGVAKKVSCRPLSSVSLVIHWMQYSRSPKMSSGRGAIVVLAPISGVHCSCRPAGGVDPPSAMRSAYGSSPRSAIGQRLVLDRPFLRGFEFLRRNIGNHLDIEALLGMVRNQAAPRSVVFC